MNKKTCWSLVAALLIITPAEANTTTTCPERYVLNVLESPGGFGRIKGEGSFALKISENGLVVAGYFMDPLSGMVAVRWVNGVATKMQRPGTAGLFAADNGNVAGVMNLSTSSVPFLWKMDGSVVLLNGISPGDDIYLQGFDKIGRPYGVNVSKLGVAHVVTWRVAEPTIVYKMEGRFSSDPEKPKFNYISQLEQGKVWAAGFYEKRDGSVHGFIWKAGQKIKVSGEILTSINADGNAVGYVLGDLGRVKPMYFNLSSQQREWLLIPAKTNAIPVKIVSGDLIIGSQFTYATGASTEVEYAGVAWKNRVFFDLKSCVVNLMDFPDHQELTVPFDVNKKGQIIGQMQKAISTSFMLTPVQ